MGVRVEEVDPRACAGEAAAVLRAAWPVPRLRYAPEDLAWQFGRPGWGPPRGWVVRDDAGAARAFAAALPRTVWHAGQRREVCVTSFYAALPGEIGVALALLRAEIRALKAIGRPCVVFAAPGSAGEAMLRANDAAGLLRNPLAVARVHGGVAGDPSGQPEAREASPADWPGVADLVARCRRAEAISDHVDPATLEYDRTDPRGRCWAVVPEPDGGVAAAACAHLSEAVTVDGPTRVATLTAVVLPADGAGAALAALVGFAARRWAGRATSPVVTLPNPSGVPPAALRAARLRALPAAWAPYLYAHDKADPLLGAAETDLEIV